MIMTTMCFNRRNEEPTGNGIEISPNETALTIQHKYKRRILLSRIRTAYGKINIYIFIYIYVYVYIFICVYMYMKTKSCSEFWDLD